MTPERAKCVRPGCNMEDGGDPRYAGLCALHAWDEWWVKSGNAEFWSKAPCIECELDRDCDKHPKADA